MEELLEQTEQQTEQQEQAAHTLALEQAKSALEERGIDPRFAAFVLAEDGELTRKKVEQFDRQLSEAMKKHLASAAEKMESFISVK